MKLSRAATLTHTVALWGVMAVALASATTRMHRSQAGTFTVNTWVLAESTEGRFSVQMPAPFDDFTLDSRDGGVLTHLYRIDAQSSDGIVLSAGRAEFPGGAEEAKKNCLRMRDEKVFGADMKSRRNFQQNGRTVVEITVNDRRAWMVMRYVCLKAEGMQISLAAPLNKVAVAESLAGKFFESLQIKDE